MDNQTKLESYIFYVRNLNDGKKERLVLGEELKLNPFKDFFDSFSTSIDSIPKKDGDKVLRFKDKTLKYVSSENLIIGIFESGDYGTEEDIIDTNTGDLKYKKQVHDANTKPFYFLIFIPENSKEGVVILQRIGVFGILNPFRKHFANFVRGLNENITLELTPLISEDLVSAYLNHGEIQDVYFSKPKLNGDVLEKYGLTNQKDDIADIEIKISSKKNRKLNLNKEVIKLLNGETPKVFNSPALRDIGFDGEHEIHINTKLDGTSPKKINLGTLKNFRPYNDISISKDSSGYPSFESLDQEARKLLKNLYTEYKKLLDA